ncbi:uncharacterized protein LOC142541864 [Primulina tabacum]|uniref:uncharacterized protein LOC142541864 n=1 Tax=Primulina tabacum TaxID=48773 RepID=UPI003F5AB0B7
MGDADRVRFAIYMFMDDASLWWEGAEHGINLATLTWARFKEMFYEKDAAEKLRHFLDGLPPTIRRDVMMMRPFDYAAATSYAFQAEQALKDIDFEMQRKRQQHQQHSQPNKKCFICKEEDHKVEDCPKKNAPTVGRAYVMHAEEAEEEPDTTLITGSITTWEDMAKAFLIKYFPPSKTMKLRADITTFSQFEQESLYRHVNVSKIYYEDYRITNCHLALCDLGASINFMPLSVFRKLGSREPMQTRMSLQLADRSVNYPRGVLEDVLVKVDKFIFPADFVVLDMEKDMEMPLILGRSFLATGKALIDVQEGKLRLRDAIKDPLEATLITELREDELDEEKAEIVAYLNANHPWKRPIRMRLEDLEDRRDLTPQKSSIEEPPNLELKPLPLKYVYLDVMEGKLLKVLKSHKSAFAWKVADIKGINPSVFMHKILMEHKYSPLVKPQIRLNPKMQEAYEDLKECFVTALVLVAQDWDIPFEVMCDSNDTAVGAVLGQQKDKVFHKIYYASKTLDEAQLNYATTEKELLAVVFALDKFHSYLVLSKVIVYTDHSALKYLLAKKDVKTRLVRWILLLQEFDLEIKDKKGVENVVADHLSRLRLIINDCVDHAINDWFPDKQLFEVKQCPCYANFVNFLVTGTPPSNILFHQRKKFFSDVKHYFWEEPFLFKICADSMIRRCVAEEEFGQILNHCHDREVGGHFGPTRTTSKALEGGFYWPNLFKYARSYVLACDKCQRTDNISNRHEMPLNNIIECECVHRKYILVAVGYVSKWIEEETYATNDLKWSFERRLLQLDQLDELQNLAYDIALSYKEKRAHDRRIIEREFKEGENVLLYNSRLRLFSGKLKSRWSGPFVISKVYPSRAVELQDVNDETFTIYAQRLKHYIGGTIKPQLGIS